MRKVDNTTNSQPTAKHEYYYHCTSVISFGMDFVLELHTENVEFSFATFNVIWIIYFSQKQFID